MKPETLDAILKDHVAVLGKTGSGKTSTEKVAVEYVVKNNFRVCVLDTTKSDWWGITSSADGKRAGLPFRILGGPRGHVPLHSSAGKVIGQLVGSGKLPLSIIDMADFEAGGLQRFFIDFAPALMRSIRGVVYLVIEEAHELAPKERAGIGAENLAIHWAKKLATAGRSKGIRLIVATQRVQALHNAVLGSCETVIAHRLTTPADQEPVIKWLKANASKKTVVKVSTSLSSLKTGTAWVCSGEAKIFDQITFPKFKTYDNTKTPTGDEAIVDVKTAPVDQDELRSIIGDAVKQAEADDPKILRKRIAELEAAARKPVTVQAPAPAADPKALDTAEKTGFDRGVKETKAAAMKEARAQIEEVVADIEKDIEPVGAAVHVFRTAAAERLKALVRARPMIAPEFFPTPKAPVIAVEYRNPKIKAAIAPGKFETLNGGRETGLDKPLQKIVDSIRWWNVMGISRPTQAQAGFVAGYSHKSGTWSTYLSRLRKEALIDGSATLTLTDSGVALAAEPRTPPTREALHEAVRDKLDAPLKKIFDPILAAYPETLSQPDAGEASGYRSTSGTWSTYLSRLRSLDLIEGSRDLKAQEWLFP